MSNNYIFKTKQKPASLFLSNRVKIVYLFFLQISKAADLIEGNWITTSNFPFNLLQ